MKNSKTIIEKPIKESILVKTSVSFPRTGRFKTEVMFNSVYGNIPANDELYKEIEKNISRKEESPESAICYIFTTGTSGRKFVQAIEMISNSLLMPL
jgi:hypothetical protein